MSFEWDGYNHKNLDEAINYLTQKRMAYIMKRGVDKKLADKERSFFESVNQHNDFIQILEKEEQIYMNRIYSDEDYGGLRVHPVVGHLKNILGERDKT